MINRHVLLIDCGSVYFKQLHSVLSELTNSISVVKIDDLNDSHNPDLYDSVIIGGSPMQMVEIDINHYTSKVRSFLLSNKPVLGICFGHQLIGLFYGSQVFQEEKRTGDENIIVQKISLLFEGLPSNFIQKEFHREHITLPDDFDLIASSSRTEVEGIQHKYKLQFGVQFHPEISGNHGKMILKNFLALQHHKTLYK